MVVIYALGLTKCIITRMMCNALLKEDDCYSDPNECLWIVPGTFDELYN